MAKKPKSKARKAPAVVPAEEVLAPALPSGEVHPVVLVKVTDLRDHPRNYRQHPDDQLDHLVASIKEHGFYRNIVVARGGYILAGHGVVKAVRKMGAETVPVIELDIEHDDPRALKVLAGDNEIPNLAEVDDRVLTELLKEISTTPLGLIGTGYDFSQLAALAMVTRPASELANINEAAEWLGMPEYEDGIDQFKLTITFKTVEDRQRFTDMAKLTVDKIAGSSWSTRWPFTDWEDAASIRFEVAS